MPVLDAAVPSLTKQTLGDTRNRTAKAQTQWVTSILHSNQQRKTIQPIENCHNEIPPRPNGVNRHLQNRPCNSCETLIPAAHGVVSKVSRILGHKESLNKYQQ